MAGLRTATAASMFVCVCVSGVCVFAFASVRQNCLKTPLLWDGTNTAFAPQTRTRKRACPYTITYASARVHTHRHTPTHVTPTHTRPHARDRQGFQDPIPPNTHARAHAHTHYRSPAQYLIVLIVATVVAGKACVSRNASKGSVSPLTHPCNPRDRDGPVGKPQS